jgi:hypothetical protein
MATKKKDRKKQANGAGSISQRADGRWMARLTLAAGGRKYYYGKTWEEVHRQLVKAQADQQQGLPIATERQTVAQFLTRWLTDTAQHRLRPGTFRRYHELVHLHTIPSLGKLHLSKLTPQHLSHLYGAKLTAGLTPRTAKGLSPRTVEFLHRVLHAALKEAVLWGLIARNPADAVKAPKPKSPPIQPLNFEQAQALLHAAAGDPLEALYVVALMTGMRQGELLGLQWGGPRLADRPSTGAAHAPVAQGRRVESRRAQDRPQPPEHQASSHRARRPQGASGATGRAAASRRASVGGSRPSIRQRGGATAGAEQPAAPLVHAATQTGGNSAHPVPRSAPHLRHARAARRGAGQGSLGDAGPCEHHPHARHVQPCPAGYAGRCGSPDGAPVGACDGQLAKRLVSRLVSIRIT